MIGPINVLGTTPGNSRWSYYIGNENKNKIQWNFLPFSVSSFHSLANEERV